MERVYREVQTVVSYHLTRSLNLGIEMDISLFARQVVIILSESLHVYTAKVSCCHYISIFITELTVAIEVVIQFVTRNVPRKKLV